MIDLGEFRTKEQVERYIMAHCWTLTKGEREALMKHAEKLAEQKGG